MVTKERLILLDSRETWRGRWNKSGNYWTPTVPWRFGTYQRTKTFDNRGWPLQRGSPRDVGGPFDTYKVTLEPPLYHTMIRYTSKGEVNYGSKAHYCPSYEMNLVRLTLLGLRPWEALDHLVNFPGASNDSLDALGSTAISRCIPTNPSAQASVALAELLREGLPRALGSTILKKGFSPRSTGEEFLNLEFGVKPLLSDVRQLYRAHQRAEEILSQLRRDSGKTVRRQYRFPVEVNESVVPLPSQNVRSDGFHTSIYLNAATTKPGFRTIRTETKTWFSGQFRYVVPSRANMSKAEELRHIYGLSFTPDVAWNLLPWSWLVDWGTNFGDVFHNISAFSNDGLVMDYGYIMRESSVMVTDENRLNAYDSKGVKRDHVLRQTASILRKQRRAAHPYGFGLTFSDLSPRQVAILASIGVTR